MQFIYHWNIWPIIIRSSVFFSIFIHMVIFFSLWFLFFRSSCFCLITLSHFFILGHFRSIFVWPEGWNVRGGGHVRTPDGHHQERVQDQDRPFKRSQSGLQRRTIHVQKSKSFLAAFIFRQMTKAFLLAISDCKCVFTIKPPNEQ